jgi:atypical dual specificity phosphatase
MQSASAPLMTRSWRSRLARPIFWSTYFWHWLRRRVGLGRSWMCAVEPNLFLAAVPTLGDLDHLTRRGVRAVINACDEYAGPITRYRELGIEQLHLPIVDYAEPSAEQVDRALDFMREHVGAGRGVLVHCKAGRGRSATLVLCWLVAERGLEPEAAQRMLAELRPRVAPGLFRRSVVVALHRRQLQLTGETAGGTGSTTTRRSSLV